MGCEMLKLARDGRERLPVQGVMAGSLPVRGEMAGSLHVQGEMAGSLLHCERARCGFAAAPSVSVVCYNLMCRSNT